LICRSSSRERGGGYSRTVWRIYIRSVFLPSSFVEFEHYRGIIVDLTQTGECGYRSRPPSDCEFSREARTTLRHPYTMQRASMRTRSTVDPGAARHRPARLGVVCCVADRPCRSATVSNSGPNDPTIGGTDRTAYLGKAARRAMWRGYGASKWQLDFPAFIPHAICHLSHALVWAYNIPQGLSPVVAP
jgi:hypothetical protein